MKVLHLLKHLNTGGITSYVLGLVKPLRQHDIEIQVLSSGGECQSDFQALGVVSHQLPINIKSELSPNLYTSIPKVIRIIRENKIDLLHAHNRPNQVLAFWVQKITGIPVVTTCHGFFKHHLGRRLLPAWGNQVIAISFGVYDHLVNDFHVPESKVLTIMNGVDIRKIDQAYEKHDPKEVRVRYGFQPQDCVIGNIARMVADKGHEFLIQAVSLLKQKNGNIKLLIVGDGRERAHLQQLVQTLGLDKQVVFTGNVKDITEPLAAIDIFVFPATWREGFGLSIIEAMICRKPVIVSNIRALNTLVKNNDTGILIEPSNSHVLADALNHLIKNSDLRRSIGASGRRMAEQNFSIERMSEEMASLYKKVLLAPV